MSITREEIINRSDELYHIASTEYSPSLKHGAGMSLSIMCIYKVIVMTIIDNIDIQPIDKVIKYLKDLYLFAAYSNMGYLGKCINFIKDTRHIIIDYYKNEEITALLAHW